MYQSRPKIKNSKVKIISFLLILFSVILFMFTPTASLFSAVIQIIAISAATASLFLLTKYIIPDYLYTVENDHFTIHKINKTKSICVADMEIGSAVAAPMTVSQYKNFIGTNKGYKVYSYIKNPGVGDIRYIPFNVSGMLISVMIEPDELFLKQISKSIENAKNAPKEEEEND